MERKFQNWFIGKRRPQTSGGRSQSMFHFTSTHDHILRCFKVLHLPFGFEWKKKMDALLMSFFLCCANIENLPNNHITLISYPNDIQTAYSIVRHFFQANSSGKLTHFLQLNWGITSSKQTVFNHNVVELFAGKKSSSFLFCFRFCKNALLPFLDSVCVFVMQFTNLA